MWRTWGGMVWESTPLDKHPRQRERPPGEAIGDRKRPTPGIPRDDQIQIEAVAGRKVEARQGQWPACVHAIDRYDSRRERAKVRAVHTTVRRVDQPEPNALARAYDHELGSITIDGHDLAPASVVREVLSRDEARIDLAVRTQSPVVGHPDFVTAVGQRLRVVDHEHTVEPALDLLGPANVGGGPRRFRHLWARSGR